MSSDSDHGVATVDPARDRLVDYLDTERRAGRTVLTLVELSQATALDPRTVERVMADLVAAPDRDVRRSTADPLRWYLRPPDPTEDIDVSR